MERIAAADWGRFLGLRVLPELGGADKLRRLGYGHQNRCIAAGTSGRVSCVGAGVGDRAGAAAVAMVVPAAASRRGTMALWGGAALRPSPNELRCESFCYISQAVYSYRPNDKAPFGDPMKSQGAIRTIAKPPT